MHNHTPICTALLMKSLFWHLHRDNMVRVLAGSLWILDLWDSSRHHLSKLSSTPDNIYILTAFPVSTTRGSTLKLSYLLANLSTLSSFYRQFLLTCHSARCAVSNLKLLVFYLFFIDFSLRTKNKLGC